MANRPRSTTAAARKAPRKQTPREDGQVTRVRYGPQVTKKICERLAQGETWFEICNTGGAPSYTTFYVWQDRYPDFAAAVATARQRGADFCADKALAVAQQATKETVQQDRLHVTTLMRRAALIAPKAWGGKTEKAERAVADKPAPIEIVFRVRHFERVIQPNGKAIVREIKPEGLSLEAPAPEQPA